MPSERDRRLHVAQVAATDHSHRKCRASLVCKPRVCFIRYFAAEAHTTACQQTLDIAICETHCRGISKLYLQTHVSLRERIGYEPHLPKLPLQA